jgi:hypothetical protein
VIEHPIYAGWRKVPDGLYSKTQLAELDFPRTPGPVRAYVEAPNYRDKVESVPLFSLAESAPSKASAAQLGAAQSRRDMATRVCPDCGARPDLPLRYADGADVARCGLCIHLHRLDRARADAADGRRAAIEWARSIFADSLIPAVVVHTWGILRPPAPSGRQNPELIAVRIEAVNATGKPIVNATVRLVGTRVQSMPDSAVDFETVAGDVSEALAAETVVTWRPASEAFAALRKMCELPKPAGWYGGNPNDMGRRVDRWRGEIDPHTGVLKRAIHPGRADRMWLLLKRMAETEI